MKKLLPILAVAMLATGGCLREGTGGCPACMNLVFTHAGSTDGFDSRIGNGVELQVYYGGVWHSTRIIPYERIAGGRSYNFRKTKAQSVQLIAYAVQIGGYGALIPQAAEGSRFEEQVVRMDAAGSRAPEPYTPKSGDIFAGTLNVEEPPHLESSHIIPMQELLCRVEVILENAEIFYKRFPGAEPSIGLLGTARTMTVYNGNTDGEEVEVVSRLAETDGNLMTPVMRVLSSPDGRKTLTVNFYKASGELAFPSFDSGEIAAPDRDITIIYRMDETSVTITLEIDGWTIRTETVPLS